MGAYFLTRVSASPSGSPRASSAADLASDARARREADSAFSPAMVASSSPRLTASGEGGSGSAVASRSNRASQSSDTLPADLTTLSPLGGKAQISSAPSSSQTHGFGDPASATISLRTPHSSPSLPASSEEGVPSSSPSLPRHSATYFRGRATCLPIALPAVFSARTISETSSGVTSEGTSLV